MKQIRAIALAACTALAGCSNVPAAAAAEPPAQPSSACPILGSSDWAAFINAMPGPGAGPRLIVTGKVTVPTGGWEFIWRDPRVMESYPVQVVMELVPQRPANATQVVTTFEVRGDVPVNPPVGSVTVLCGNKTLARIAPVETAH